MHFRRLRTVSAAEYEDQASVAAAEPDPLLSDAPVQPAPEEEVRIPLLSTTETETTSHSKGGAVWLEREDDAVPLTRKARVRRPAAAVAAIWPAKGEEKAAVPCQPLSPWKSPEKPKAPPLRDIMHSETAAARPPVTLAVKVSGRPPASTAIPVPGVCLWCCQWR
jgi:hypothetical protein